MKSTFVLFLSVLLAFSLSSCSKEKEGCTDPLSSNYDPDAKKDNGSCKYDTIAITQAMLDASANVVDTGLVGLHNNNPDLTSHGGTASIRDIFSNLASPASPLANSTVIAKTIYEKLPNGARGARQADYIIFAREDGYFADGNDYEYIRIPFNAATDYNAHPRGELNKADQRGKLFACSGCHTLAQKDFLFHLDQ